MSGTESYASVWDAIADTPEQAANLRARAELMQKIAARLKQNARTQAEAASRCGVAQPRINDLLRGRVSRFSLDALVNIATALGCRVRSAPTAPTWPRGAARCRLVGASPPMMPLPRVGDRASNGLHFPISPFELSGLVIGYGRRRFACYDSASSCDVAFCIGYRVPIHSGVARFPVAYHNPDMNTHVGRIPPNDGSLQTAVSKAVAVSFPGCHQHLSARSLPIQH